MKTLALILAFVTVSAVAQIIVTTTTTPSVAPVVVMVANPAHATWLNGVGAAYTYDQIHGDFDAAIKAANDKMTNEYATLTQGERDGITQDINWILAAKQFGREPAPTIPAP